MMKNSYLAMKTDPALSTTKLITSDLQDIGNAAKKLANHAIKLTLGFGLASTLLQWIASIAAIYLLIVDRTNWRTNILTSLLVPYIFFSLPSVLFNLLSGEIGKWIAFLAVVVRLFFPRRFPGWFERPGAWIHDNADSLEMPCALILLVVVAPSLFSDTIRGSWIGLAICLVIGGYLLQEHIRASGGFKNSFTKSNGISNTVGIVILLVYPVWALVTDIL